MSWTTISIGNVVRWAGSLWIVYENTNKGLKLVDFTESNVTASI
jgi:hypothetical protein